MATRLTQALGSSRRRTRCQSRQVLASTSWASSSPRSLSPQYSPRRPTSRGYSRRQNAIRSGGGGTSAPPSGPPSGLLSLVGRLSTQESRENLWKASPKGTKTPVEALTSPFPRCRCRKLDRLHAARSYSWIRPPRTSRLITDPGGAPNVSERDLGTGGFISSER